jgi:hypothetical protein
MSTRRDGSYADSTIRHVESRSDGPDGAERRLFLTGARIRLGRVPPSELARAFEISVCAPIAALLGRNVRDGSDVICITTLRGGSVNSDRQSTT